MCVLLLAARPGESLERRGSQFGPVRKFSRREPGDEARKARRKVARIGGEGDVIPGQVTGAYRNTGKLAAIRPAVWAALGSGP